jgi:hypothetical protein
MALICKPFVQSWWRDMIIGSAAILFALAASPSLGGAMEPVTIQGTRFYSARQPYFPAAHFLLYENKSVLSYFSYKYTDADRQGILNNNIAAGHNTIFLYLMNQDRKIVTPYVDRKNIIGGEFDEVRIQNWRAELLNMIAQHLRPVLWLIPDDSPKVKNAPLPELKRYIQKMVASFDDLPIMWVLGLEIDEYWDKARSDELGSYLKLLSINPVGIHQRSGMTHYMRSSWVDFGAYQNGFSGDWLSCYNAAISKQAEIGNKPLLFAEYKRGAGFTASQKGLAAMFGGSAGVGNGAPKGLAQFMESLPDGMVPWRNGNTLFLSGSGVTAEADISTLTFSAQRSKSQ